MHPAAELATRMISRDGSLDAEALRSKGWVATPMMSSWFFDWDQTTTPRGVAWLLNFPRSAGSTRFCEVSIEHAREPQIRGVPATAEALEQHALETVGLNVALIPESLDFVLYFDDEGAAVLLAPAAIARQLTGESVAKAVERFKEFVAGYDGSEREYLCSLALQCESVSAI